MHFLIIRFQKCRKDCKCKTNVKMEHGPYVYLRSNSSDENRHKKNRYHDKYISHARNLSTSILAEKIPNLRFDYVIVDIVRQITENFNRDILELRRTFSFGLGKEFFN